MSSERIAIVGIGLRYPDAATPDELWENVLAGRRAFRRLPNERMNRADYWSPDPEAPDRFYSTMAAVLRDFEFDRVAYQVAGSTYRSTDLTHWLALDVAARALADAGFPRGEGLPTATTGVVLGNSLTGEFSRANTLRLRWPYVRRTLAAALADKGWSDAETAAFLGDLETRYKAPFPAVDEDSLAGGLANTIAGRICNHFDLGGGGYIVDGACSSSLLSIATAAKALVDEDLDVALAGGVDLSIDPFEVIGFAKTGALATGEMVVYDRDSNGFWPGEGAGVLVLMREADAVAQDRRIYASIAGWGISSDGKGGITRPEASGHRRALARAYGRAGYGVETVSYFEGHGTGTALGDATELTALSTARHAAAPDAPPAAVSSIKGNLGHTKAAAGVVGLIKATLAVHHQVIPPATGHRDPHPSLLTPDAAVYVPRDARAWPEDQPVRAGVSAMGFGGINTHLTVEQPPGTPRRTAVDAATLATVAARQDVELLLVAGADLADVRERLARLRELTGRLAYAELADLAYALATEAADGPVRAAVVADSPADAERRLGLLLAAVDDGRTRIHSVTDGIFLGEPSDEPRISFLFPGQGSGRGGAGVLRRRFGSAAEAFAAAGPAEDGDPIATQVAQPRIVAGSLAGLRVLRDLGIEATAAVGHSLGELTALHWAGALTAPDLGALAAARGKAMASASRTGGGMASLTATGEETALLVADEDDVVVAGYNGPRQTVVSGPATAVDRVCAKARAAGHGATRLSVSHAFHSPLVAPASRALAAHLETLALQPVRRRVVSTVTGGPLDAAEDLATLLRDQVVRPVRFHQAAVRVAADADLLIEVGPGRVLTGLVAEITPGTPAFAVDTESDSLRPLLSVVAAAFVLGAPVRTETLFTHRVIRPLSIDGPMTFLASPCEQAPAIDVGTVAPVVAAEATAADPLIAVNGSAPPAHADSARSTLELLRELAAARAELPSATITADTHPLDDLHLSSITVGQIVNQAVRDLGRPPLTSAPSFATVRLGELAALIDDLAETAHAEETVVDEAAGAGPWVRAFTVDHVAEPAPIGRPPAAGATSPGDWAVHAPSDHPLAAPLGDALAHAGLGDGVLLCLPERCDDQDLALLLAASRDVLGRPAGTRLVVVQHRFGASGLAKTLHLEAPSVPTTIVELPDVAPVAPADLERAVSRVRTEVAATTGFAEVRFDADGTRRVPVLRARPVRPSAARAADTAAAGALGPADVLLVTGGGKGITAECALALAEDSSAALVLLGRSDPDTDAELAANLARLTAKGVRHRYERADVTSAEEVAAAVGRAVQDLGPVTAVLHGAGRNEPSSLAGLTEEEFRATLAPKVAGLRAVLAAVDPDRLRLLLTFGSVIGRAGLRGEAHYATANDWMTELTVRFQREHPRARALALEWSVWSGAGMGERLGVVEALRREGVTAVPAEDGIAMLRQVLADPDAGPVVVIGGRMSGLPTLAVERVEPPLLRFVDRVLVHYPGVELVTETTLSAGSDPYLADHLLAGDLLLPAVVGMEAMAQVAAVLLGDTPTPVLHDAEFLRPVVVRPDGTTTVRLAGLVVDAETVDVVIRSEETGFGADHFRARLRLPRGDRPVDRAPRADELPAVPLDPDTELYGDVLFQGRRFQRLLRYRRAAARHAVAELSTRPTAPWFAEFLPQRLLLADPGTRDAAMHALQCCVPDATLLPERIERLHLADPAAATPEYVVLDARERSQDGDSHTYDLDLRDPHGVLVERWEGLVLRAVARRDGTGPWAPALLGPHLERSLERVLGSAPSTVVEPDPPSGGPGRDVGRREQTELAVSRALGRRARVHHRPDGRPEIESAPAETAPAAGRRQARSESSAPLEMSASHGAGLTMVVAGAGPLGCDVEPAVDRPEADWAGLLGAELLPVRDLAAAEAGEDRAVASTRVWAAVECARKAGTAAITLTVDRVHPDGWTVFSAGRARVGTWVTTVEGRPVPTVFAVLVGEGR
ncbi:enediyne polyketide synthase [Actinoalloteichus hoggarensis]|uniref:Phthiocerol/phenolphthiocerol synthesis polyketide synthase type I PpsA n=1 Tax=Actinoalloteichus hoggarensis TaxID=1470176 RepID=A0A221W5D2_9PSEU|nr:type I polyketide synthase [Actinoalloteichus hoggarensis]ASO20943.1 Phthiocerol/phenolphthiocerol synthesis polyketide synthase type I PpsA [Actinoalloteichus hoggarensis]MBB5920874.1 enediyne polyketide synthase [Actinoalloteichus hoggarensis]